LTAIAPSLGSRALGIGEFRMKRYVVIAAILAAAGGSAGEAAAQGADWKLCAPEVAGDGERSIEACSRIVAAPALKVGDRAAAYVHRGTIFLRRGDTERAISDYDAALQLRPGDVVALNRRGEARSNRAEFIKALADYDQAVRLNPRYPLAFRNRARIHFYRGDFVAAAEDFRTAESIDRGNSYSLLWRYIADARSGVVDSAGLAFGWPRLRDGWPKPLVAFYIDRIDEAAMFAAAAAGPARAEQECEARFFLGQKHILAGARDAAIAALRHARESCPRHMAEFHAAGVELTRLGVATR
jgi:lipoprotein NlpI